MQSAYNIKQDVDSYITKFFKENLDKVKAREKNNIDMKIEPSLRKYQIQLNQNKERYKDARKKMSLAQELD